MATFPLYNLSGEKVGTVERPALFEAPIDEKLIHRYFLWVRTMLRDAVAHTKTRGEVSGGGRKPWKQKGTGRARFGSTRNPLWRHGGTVFGPRNDRNFHTRMPRAERRKALFSIFASKTEGVVVLSEAPVQKASTKEFIATLAKLPIQGKKILLINGSFDEQLFNAARNLPMVTAKTVSHVNAIDLLNNDVLLFTKQSLVDLETHFTPIV